MLQFAFKSGIIYLNIIRSCPALAQSLHRLQQVLDHGGVDRVMLDNFSVENTRKAVEIIAGRVETESSGGITIDTLRAYGECGVDYISVGALTHSIKSLDMSFKAC